MWVIRETTYHLLPDGIVENVLQNALQILIPAQDMVVITGLP